MTAREAIALAALLAGATAVGLLSALLDWAEARLHEEARRA